MIKNRLNFVPAKCAIQPEFYIKRFDKVTAVFRHPNGRNIFLQVDAQLWMYRNPYAASGPLLVLCQTTEHVKQLSAPYDTLAEAMMHVEALMKVPGYGDRFEATPIPVEDLRDGRFPNKVLLDKEIKAHRQYRKAHPYRKPKIPFELTEEDKRMLRDWGHPVEDFPQIENAANLSIFDLDGEKSVSWEEAVEAIGREQFLSGISRSAFHWSSSRDGVDSDGIGHEVFFESGKESPFRKDC